VGFFVSTFALVGNVAQHKTEERLLDGAARSVASFIDALEECDCGWAAEREDGGNSSRRAQEDREMVHEKIKERQ
jgi:hypothetical protein